jgi:hypothetical protein
MIILRMTMTADTIMIPTVDMTVEETVVVTVEETAAVVDLIKAWKAVQTCIILHFDMMDNVCEYRNMLSRIQYSPDGPGSKAGKR